MDFARVTALLSAFLDEAGHGYALAGGLGMAAHGMVRATFDVDIVVSASAQEELIGFLTSLGYETLHRSSGYSNHLHDDPDLGRVDVVYVSGGTRDELFAGATRRNGPGGIEIAVVRPEHLAAMKVFAMKNDPSRTFRELEDIRFLLTLPGIDRNEVRGYFEKHGLERRYAELEETL